MAAPGAGFPALSDGLTTDMEQTPWDPEGVAVGLDADGRASGAIDPAWIQRLDPRALYKRLSAARSLDHRLATLGLPMWAPAAGEEAVSVAVALLLGEGEWVYPGLRDLALGPMLGMDLGELAGQVLGRAGYFGRPGSIAATDLGVAAVPEALGVHLAIAAGQAHGHKLAGGGKATVAIFGEGLTTVGVFHETVALAAAFDLPLVLVCKSQLWPDGAPPEAGLLGDSVADRAGAAGLWTRRADGADVIGVHHALAQALARARDGGGPSLVEVIVTPLLHPDAPAHRDPLERVRRHLDHLGLWSPDFAAAIEAEIEDQLARAFAQGGAA